jgi:hypothetical protein
LAARGFFGTLAPLDLGFGVPAPGAVAPGGLRLGGGALGVEGEQAIDDGVFEQRDGGALGVGLWAEWRDGDVGPAIGGEHCAIEFLVKPAELLDGGEIFGPIGGAVGPLSWL